MIHLRMEGSGAVNTSVTFSCDLGYKLSGSSSLSCNRDVTWSDALPSCIQGGGAVAKIYYMVMANFRIKMTSDIKGRRPHDY